MWDSSGHERQPAGGPHPWRDALHAPSWTRAWRPPPLGFLDAYASDEPERRHRPAGRRLLHHRARRSRPRGRWCGSATPSRSIWRASGDRAMPGPPRPSTCGSAAYGGRSGPTPTARPTATASVYLELVEPERIHYRDAPNDWPGGLDGLPPAELISTITLTERDGPTTVLAHVKAASITLRDETVARGFSRHGQHGQRSARRVPLNTHAARRRMMPFVTSKDGTQIGYSVVGLRPGDRAGRRRHVLARRWVRPRRSPKS